MWTSKLFLLNMPAWQTRNEDVDNQAVKEFYPCLPSKTQLVTNVSTPGTAQGCPSFSDQNIAHTRV